MSAFRNKIANWHYADGFRYDKTFEGGRTMIVVAASAYNANGLIGSEYNGIVVIDADHSAIVLQRHLPSSSGSSGPTHEQRVEFDYVTSLPTWQAFASWLKATPGYRGGVPDIDADKPTPPSEASIVAKAAAARTVPGLPGESILPDALVQAHDKPELKYTYPLRTRLDMAAFIAGHAMRKEMYGDGYLAWDIKVHSPDMSGTYEGGEQIAPALDALWKNHAAANHDDLFWQACRDAVRQYADGDATTYPGDNQGALKFEVQGRQGGWLVLKEWHGVDMGFATHGELVDKLLEMEPSALATLYGDIVCLDADITPEQDFAYQMNVIRHNLEQDDWNTPEAAETAARELGMEEWVHPSRMEGPRPF